MSLIMYRYDWIEQLKLGQRTHAASRSLGSISPVVWSLGFTSLLTDISSEMVNSVLPVYLVLHLHLSPLQFGLVDGLYNGFAIALFSLLAGYYADRRSRQKEVALAGYALSGVCKLFLLAIGASWTWVLVVIGLDRTGKGMRSAPRDALISLNTPAGAYASAFAVHRALDACGSLLGPIAAFILLAQLPGAFDAVWITSFVFAVLGVSVLWLFVPRAAKAPEVVANVATAVVPGFSWISRRFLALAGVGGLLAAVTISDGFIYLLMQERSAVATGFFPLFYVLTAASYMLFSIPAGRLADRTSRSLVFLGGYAMLVALYAVLFTFEHLNTGVVLGCLAMLGMYYAATEGVLMALASAVIPAQKRTMGIAIIATAIGLAKLLSSVVFGALWQQLGARNAVIIFVVALGVALAGALALLRATDNET
ncbi:MAG TPA: MFS transporter [Povalibacter sp.]